MRKGMVGKLVRKGRAACEEGEGGKLARESGERGGGGR